MILQEVFAPVNEIKPLSREQMDAMDKAREEDDSVKPELQKPAPGFFDGMGEASWKGVASGALKSASAFDTVLSSTGMVRAALNNAQVETGYTFDDLDKRQSEIENRLDQDSKELRRRAREDYGADPSTMGTAAQIIYGVAETIPKAIGYSILAGPAGGSVLFGADLGISRAQELMDEGVDKNTAINAGLVTFAAGALGMRLPATFGRSRIASATIGAVANMGLTAAELQGVNWVLQNQNYNELAQKYQLNIVDMATSGIFGGVLGGVMWRPSATATAAQNAAARRAPLRDRIYNSLRRASPENISDDAIRVQADLHAAGIQVMADRAQIDADAIAPEIVRMDYAGSPTELNQSNSEPELESGMTRLYHGGYGDESLTVLDNEGLFDGIFASGSKSSAASHGKDLYYTDINDNDILSQDELSYEIDPAATEAALRKAYPNYENLSDSEKDIVWDSVIEDKANDYWDDLVDIFGSEDGGYASWEAQRLRGRVAGELGYKAVEMDDEHGTSYLILPGATLSRVPEYGFNQRAWHGSPYTFDRFSTNNIGSGTGRSTYGWGLYFTKDKKVAEFYRNSLGGDSRLYEVNVPEDDALLNSDDTFAQQPKKIREAINKLYNEEYGENPPPDWWDGRQIYQDIILREEGYTDPDDIPGAYEMDMDNGELAGNARLASEKLNSIGVKGVKFIGDNEDTSFVVFDDKAIQTIDFYQERNLGKPVVELTGVEIATMDTPLNELRDLAKNWYDANLRGKKLKNEKSGMEVEFAGSRKAISSSANPDKLRLFPAVGYVIEKGDISELIPVDSNRAKAQNIRGYRWITAPVRLGDKMVELGVTVREDNNGRLYYNHNIVENETPSNSEFKPLTKQALEQRGDMEDISSTNNDILNIFVRQLSDESSVRGSFDPARNRITLTPNANISTYSHEMGHWYLENLFQLSRRAVSESTLKEDADILLKEFGVKSLDDWDALGIEGQRKYQEQFASWVEIYLSEGRAPKPALQRLFERLGQWLVDLYRELGGVKKAVGDTYKAETGSELPPVSEEVGKVLDRLFAQDREIRRASQVSKAQVAAARMVQANRTNNNKLEEIIAMPNGKNKTRALRDLEKSTKAQLKAIQAAKRGLPVDVSQEVEQMNVDVDRLVEMKGNFGRAYVMGNNDSAIILQNRDRSDVGSIGQMNTIAANPQYGLVSVSRSYSGAPVVSYGQVPDNAHLGNNDFIVETNGNRVPFMYAVVEAGDVETSNFIDGSTNTGYGNPQRMNAVVGNGRMTALKEAYQRGTANQYRTDLESDTAHGIKPEVIREMKNPVLVRVINPEDVNTGFISRSNGQQVLALDDVEVAREDAPKIRARADQYEFDEAGNPTNDTLALFIQDLHDPNALGRLITSDGRPTPEAVRRIRNAVFFEAYQSPELSALFSQEVDPGIRRILNGLANVAPRIIELREQAQELDFSNLLVEAANRIRQARLNPDEGVDFASQMSFLDNPATSAFVEFLDDNANSAAAIARTLNPLIDWAQNAAQAADGGLFGGDAEVHVDLADVVGQLRNIINDQRAGAGLEPLPEIDIAAIRDQIQSAVNTATDAVNEVGARLEVETQQAEMEMADEAHALDAQRQQSFAVLDEKTSVDARAQFLMDQNPDQVYRVLDENGMEVEGTLGDLLAQADEDIRQAEVEASGIGRAVECVLRNGGI